MTKNDIGKVYDTLLSMPGMNEQIKVDFKMDRKTILLLSQVIERGIATNNEQDNRFGLADVVNHESMGVLKALASEALEKAGMTELNHKLASLTAEL